MKFKYWSSFVWRPLRSQLIYIYAGNIWTNNLCNILNENMSGSILLARQCRLLRCKIPVYQQANNIFLRYTRLGCLNVAALPEINRRPCRLMSLESNNKIDDARPGTKHDQVPKDNEQDLSKKTNRQKLSLVFAKYGVTAVVFHTMISLTSLGLCYIAVSRLVVTVL